MSYLHLLHVVLRAIKMLIRSVSLCRSLESGLRVQPSLWVPALRPTSQALGITWSSAPVPAVWMRRGVEAIDKRMFH